MSNFLEIKKKINPFNKILNIEGDKSLSIRWALLASQAEGKSSATNLLMSEDVLNTIKCLKQLGVKIKFYNIYIQRLQVHKLRTRRHFY